MTNNWPLQKDCDAFYGNPRGGNARPDAGWVSASIIAVPPPFAMSFDGAPVRKIQFHRKAADALMTALDHVWDAAGKDQRVIDEWGANLFGGSFVYRLMRGSTRLSMHGYGCAIDLDPVRNAMGDATGHFTAAHPVVKAFQAVGAEWGGGWQTRPDPMHFQFARTK